MAGSERALLLAASFLLKKRGFLKIMADMMSVRFYRNKYVYPDYLPTVTAVTEEVSCTPRNFGSRNGTIIVDRRFLDMESVNYLKFRRGTGRTFWAWIDDIVFHTENSWLVSYTVDAWRTYQDVINLDSQFIARSSVATNLRDELLGSTQPYPDIHVKNFAFQKSLWRTFVIQVRLMSADVIYSRSPVQPSPYQFYTIDYEVNNWTNTPALVTLMDALGSGAETQNIVTMYSIPYMNTSALGTAPLVVHFVGGATTSLSGFKFVAQDIDPSGLLFVEEPITYDVDINSMLRVNHSVQLVIPDAGIIDIPDELLLKTDLRLRQDVDLYSGASNYMLVSGTDQIYAASVRGSSVTSIPIISDPYDTYISQNQNSLTTSLLGDVASIAAGVGTAVMSGGIGAAVGGGMAASGASGLVDYFANKQDNKAGASYSNPPAFLGTALAAKFSQKFWMIVTRDNVQNEGLVHAENGYPMNMMSALEFPWSGGVIETKGCAVHSIDGTVPRWAIQEINAMFDAGLEVQTS